MRQEEKGPVPEEPGLVLGKGRLEEVEVALADGETDGHIEAPEWRGFFARKKGLRGEDAKKEVCGDQVG